MAGGGGGSGGGVYITAGTLTGSGPISANGGSGHGGSGGGGGIYGDPESLYVEVAGRRRPLAGQRVVAWRGGGDGGRPAEAMAAFFAPSFVVSICTKMPSDGTVVR